MSRLFKKGDSSSTSGNGSALLQWSTESARSGHGESHTEPEHFEPDTEPDDRNPGMGKTESLITYAAAIVATFLVRRAIHISWQTALKRDPPKNLTSKNVAWKDALLWGAISGAIVGIARIGSRRATSAVYRSYAGRRV